MMLHDFMTFVVAMLCVWAAISPKVPTGIFGALGLGVLATSALISMDDSANPYLVTDAMLGGLGLVGMTVFYRVRHRKPAGDASGPPSAHELDESHQVHIVGGKGGS
jgi:hypothetical protein